MDGLECTRCGQPLYGGDAFCGRCGARAPDSQRVTTSSSLRGSQYPFSPASEPPDLMPSGTARQPTGSLKGQQGAWPVRSGDAFAFFSHEPPRRSSRLSNATRYLCAASYLDDRFANRVIRELITTRRAVAPSLEVDLGPVLWHCQRARRNFLIRSIVLVVIVVLGLVLNPVAAAGFLGWTVILGWLLPMAKRKHGGPTLWVLFVAAFIALVAIGVTAFSTVSSISISSFSSGIGPGGSVSGSAGSAEAATLKIVGVFPLLLALEAYAKLSLKK
jgi:hypothetical protein